MLPLPTDFPYPDHYFSYEAVRNEDELWHPLVLGRDLTFYIFIGSLGRSLAFNLQYSLASRLNPFQSFLSKFFFEKFFFFQDYTLPYLWIYFPWITFFFNYPVGTFQVQFDYYFPFFFYFSCFIAFFFFLFSSFFYVNRTKFDYFSIILTFSFFFFAFPIFLFFSIPIFLSSFFLFFFFYTFAIPISIRFANYVRFVFPNFFSYRQNVGIYFLTSSASSTNVFSTESKLFFPNYSKFYKVNWSSFSIQEDIKNRNSFCKKRFTIYPFFNFNLKDKKNWIHKVFCNKHYYSFSNLRFKNKLNDIRQIIPFEGPSVYDPNLPYYDLERIRLNDTYEELESLVEDDIELDYGPDFEENNDTGIPLENYDEWEFFSKSHFNFPKFKNTKVPFIKTFSQDIDMDLRPILSNWIQNEIGRVWILKNWLRYLNPRHSDKPLTFTLLESSTLYPKHNLSNFFSYLLKFFSFYFVILENFFNFFFPPWIVRSFSTDIKKNEFFSYLLKLKKIENSFFFIPSHFSNFIRILYSLETYFIKNNKNFSFSDKIHYFSLINSLLNFFKNQIKYGIYSDFYIKCVISQLSRMLGRFKN